MNKFVDEIEITVRAGHGGAGSVHFVRKWGDPYDGPDGGDGGRGGDVYIAAHPSMQQLGHFLKQNLYAAERGHPGRENRMHGKDGGDITLNVPPGTIVIDVDTEEELGDLTRPDSVIKVAKGGKGGLGNSHFATSTNQAPRYAQPGLAGDERRLSLQLKLLADAGLIGLPNAGKSTLLSAVSGNHPKIAGYAFTTLTPNLGVVQDEDETRRLLLADIPGIIEGASRGAGLGLSFLRHIERVRVMVYVLDITSLDPAADLAMLQAELETYSSELLRRPALVMFNKADLIDYDHDLFLEVSAAVRDPALWHAGVVPEVQLISADKGDGRDEFIDALFQYVPAPSLAEEMLPT